jgi:hypothetical protein
MLKPTILLPKREALARLEGHRDVIEAKLARFNARLVRVSIEHGDDYYDPDTGYYTIVLVVRIGNRLRALKPEELELDGLLE